MYRNFTLEDLERHKKEIDFWIKQKSKEKETTAEEKLEELMIENKDVLVRLKNEIPKSYLFGHIHCPVNGWDCPYFDANGCCMMYPDNDPIEECDDFATFWDTEDDYICYDKH